MHCEYNFDIFIATLLASTHARHICRWLDQAQRQFGMRQRLTTEKDIHPTDRYSSSSSSSSESPVSRALWRKRAKINVGANKSSNGEGARRPVFYRRRGDMAAVRKIDERNSRGAVRTIDFQWPNSLSIDPTHCHPHRWAQRNLISQFAFKHGAVVATVHKNTAPKKKNPSIWYFPVCAAGLI
jgi:hypothetical protein